MYQAQQKMLHSSDKPPCSTLFFVSPDDDLDIKIKHGTLYNQIHT